MADSNRRIVWLNVVTVISAAILIGAEVFGAAFAGSWALATLFDLGSARQFYLSVESQGNSLFSQTWASVLAQGGLSELKNGYGYALILNGPRADLKAVPNLWNAATLTAVAVDPE